MGQAVKQAEGRRSSGSGGCNGMCGGGGGGGSSACAWSADQPPLSAACTPSGLAACHSLVGCRLPGALRAHQPHVTPQDAKRLRQRHEHGWRLPAMGLECPCRPDRAPHCLLRTCPAIPYPGPRRSERGRRRESFRASDRVRRQPGASRMQACLSGFAGTALNARCALAVADPYRGALAGPGPAPHPTPRSHCPGMGQCRLRAAKRRGAGAQVVAGREAVPLPGLGPVCPACRV